MRKRRVFLILIAGVVCIGVIAAILAHDSEPVYQGKKLSEWVCRLDLSDPVRFGEIDDALHHIGTSAIPYLLDWARYEPSESKTKRLSRVNFYLERINRAWQIYDTKWIRAQRAGVALGRLRPESEKYLPELEPRLYETNGFDHTENTLNSLLSFGAAGRPALFRYLSNGPPKWKAHAIARLGQMGTSAGDASPVLHSLLRDPDSGIRAHATNALLHLQGLVPEP